MNELDKTLRERLLNMETLDSVQGGMSREQMQAVLDTRLDGVKRIGFALLALVGLCTAIPFGHRAFSGGGNDWEDLAICGLFMMFAFFVSVAWTVLNAWVAISGRVRRMQRAWIVATTLVLGFCYLVALMFVFVIPISHEESLAELGTQLGLIWFFLLNTLGLCVILGVLYRGQYKSQEKLLEIEYRLADLADKIEGTRKQQD
ncbi:MAG: hypothetical protein ABFD90_07120 [Phycisphaerales bacterium]